jgi:nucleotide-binding universal stress UspA family protein
MHALVIGIRDDSACPGVLEWAATIALDTDAAIRLVHAIPRRSVWVIAGMQVDSTTYVAHRRSHFERRVLEPLRRRGVRAKLDVEVGDAADHLLEVAHETRADLIAIGGPHHGRLHDAIVGAMFGTTASKLAHITDVPIVVIPALHAEPSSAAESAS